MAVFLKPCREPLALRPTGRPIVIRVQVRKIARHNIGLTNLCSIIAWIEALIDVERYEKIDEDIGAITDAVKAIGYLIECKVNVE